MSNIIHLATRTADFSTAKDNNIYFPVSLQEFEVPFNNGEVADASPFAAVVREDTRKVLAVHSAKYNLVTNEHLYGQFEESLRSANTLDLTDMYINVKVNDDGASVIKEYNFPAHQVEIKKGDFVDMQLRVRNSYDGRWAFSTILGGFRLVCTNGMVVGQKFLSDYGRHTKNLNIESTVACVDAAIQIYLDQQNVWKHWASKVIYDDEVLALIDGLIPNKQLANTIYDLYLVEQETLGRTAWALFNALTYWSTHYKRKAGAQLAVTQDNREKQVRKVITSKQFLRMVA